MAAVRLPDESEAGASLSRQQRHSYAYYNRRAEPSPDRPRLAGVGRGVPSLAVAVTRRAKKKQAGEPLVPPPRARPRMEGVAPWRTWEFGGAWYNCREGWYNGGRREDGARPYSISGAHA
jgi:hypothetical protein